MPIGIYRDSDGAQMVFDGVLGYSLDPRVILTEHPIEDGSSVSDHAIKMPLRLTMRIQVSESPMVANESTETITGPARLQEAMRFLSESVGELMTITDTKEGTFESMAIESYPHSYGTHESIQPVITFKQIEIPTSITTEIPATVPRADVAAGAATEKQLGRQATKKIAKESAAAQADSSILVSILGL